MPHSATGNIAVALMCLLAFFMIEVYIICRRRYRARMSQLRALLTLQRNDADNSLLLPPTTLSNQRSKNDARKKIVDPEVDFEPRAENSSCRCGYCGWDDHVEMPVPVENLVVQDKVTRIGATPAGVRGLEELISRDE